MFKRLTTDNNTFSFTFDGTQYNAQSGETIAAALLANGVVSLRKTHTSTSLRGPYCMMGACYDCLVRIDGRTVQSCMLAVKPGMQVDRAKAQDEHSDG